MRLVDREHSLSSNDVLILLQEDKMDKDENKAKKLEYFKTNVKMKLSALWIVLMILYIYNDFFALFTPGALEEMMEGKMGPFSVTQFGLLTATIMMIVPAIMIFLSLTLKSKVNRILNIIAGAAYTLIGIGNLIGETWAFYLSSGIIQIVLTLLVIWHAYRWPKLS
jgi:hypothetical protein